jgi:ectoine hydroxylase-related dioxygenase (phytanoyl-CoA dioxygenase family)
VWFSLDSVRIESGAVEYLAGSHRWGAEYHPEKFGDVGSEEVDLPRVPDIDAQRARLAVEHFDIEPGDCVVHHGLTIHGAPGNQSENRRRAVVTRWLGDDVRYLGGPLASRHPYDSGLTPGERPACELFPLVWVRPAP